MSLRERVYHAPRQDVVAPVRISCPTCNHELGRGLRVTLESEWSASTRPATSEAYLVCPSCRKSWVAALWLSIAAFAGSEVAA